jgi:hypothetical protein
VRATVTVGTRRRIAANGRRTIDSAARVMLRPVGNPLPLGFLVLAGGTLLVSGLQLGWLASDEAQRSVGGPLKAQLAPLEREAGAREQL